MKWSVFSFTPAQVDALIFACSNTLAEPANFERGTNHERTEAPMRRAMDKLQASQVKS